MEALVKLTGPNRKVWFLSEDGETINAIKNNQEVYKFSGSGSDTPTAEPVYTYKGSKDTYEELPTEDNAVGDVWNVVAAHEGYAAGMNYAWNGTDWDAIGGLYADTWRPIQIDGTAVLTDSTTSLNFKADTNVSITYENDKLIISATDTTYSEAVPSTNGVGGSAGLMSATDKEKLIKLPGESTEYTFTNNSVNLQLVQNTITNCTSAALASVSINGADVDFKYCTIIFSSPSTATQFSMPDDGYYYCVGDDCSGGDFTPVADMRYNLAAMLEYDRIAIYVMRAL